MFTKRIRSALALAACIIITAAALNYARLHELIAAEAAQRTLQVIFGLLLAVQGNFVPKITSRSRACALSQPQSALRTVGWSLVLAGLGYAGLWAFAPLPFARAGGIIVVATAVILRYFVLGCRRVSNGA